MDKELEAIVKRMIDAGESHESITAVINEYNSKKKSGGGGSLDQSGTAQAKPVAGLQSNAPAQYPNISELSGIGVPDVHSVELQNRSKLTINPATIPVPVPFTTGNKEAVSQYTNGLQQRIASKTTTDEDRKVIDANLNSAFKFGDEDRKAVHDLASKNGLSVDKYANSTLPHFITSMFPELEGRTVGELAGTAYGNYTQLSSLKSKLQSDIATAQQQAGMLSYKEGEGGMKDKLLGEIVDKQNQLSKVDQLIYKISPSLHQVSKEGVDDVHIQSDAGLNDLEKLGNRARSILGGKWAEENKPEVINTLEKLPAAFMTGLEDAKYTEPVVFERLTRALKNGEPISATQKATLIARGLDIEEQKLNEAYGEGVSKITEDQYAAEHKKINDVRVNAIIKTPEVLRGMMSQHIAEYINKKESDKEDQSNDVIMKTANTLFGYRWRITDQEIADGAKDFANAYGFDANSAEIKAQIKNLQDNEGGMFLENSIAKGGVTRSLLRGAAGVIKGVSRTGEDLVPVALGGKTTAQVYAERQSEVNADVEQQRLKSEQTGWRGVVTSASEGLGQLVGQIGLMSTTGGILGGAAKGLLGRAGIAALEGDVALADMSASDIFGKALLKSKDFTSVTLTGMAQSYDSHLKDALSYTSDNTTAKRVATTLAAMEGLSENILSPLEIAHGIGKGLFKVGKVETESILKALTDSKIVDKSSVIKNILTGAAKGTLAAAKVAGSESMEELVTQWADFGANMLLNPNSESFQSRDFKNETISTVVDTGLSMSIPALLSGLGAASNVNNFNKGTLLMAAQNRQHMLEKIDEQLANGDLTPDEANEKIKIINTAEKANNSAPKKFNNQPLNADEKADYVYSRTAEAILKDRHDKSDDEAERQMLDTKIKEHQDFRSNILKVDDSEVKTPAPENTTSEDVKTDVPTPKTEATTESTKSTETKAEPVLAAAASEEIPAEDKITVGDMLDKSGTYNGKRGSFVQDGQTVVFKESGANREYELGNIEDVKDKPIADYGIAHEESIVSTNDNGNHVVRGKEYVNNYSDPTQAINRDAEGNVVSVSLEDTKGKKVTFRGNVAEDLAYQIHLKEINKNNETRQGFEDFINNDKSTAREVRDGAVSQTSETATAQNNEQVQRTKIEPITTSETVDNGETKDNTTDVKGDNSATGQITEQPVEFTAEEKAKRKTLSAEDKKAVANLVKNPDWETNPTLREQARNIINGVKKTSEAKVAEPQQQKAESKGALVLNTQNVDRVHDDSPAGSTRAEVIKQAKNVVKSLKSFAPNLKVAVYDTDAEQKAAVLGKTTRGVFDPNTNTIHLNLQAIARAKRNNTAYHEGVHPVLNALIKSNPKLIDSLNNQIEKLAETNESVVHSIEFGNTHIQTHGLEVAKMETVVEFISQVASGHIKITPSIKQSVVNIINKFLNLINANKKLRLDSNISDIRDFASAISNAFRSGADVTSYGIGEMVVKGSEAPEAKLTLQQQQQRADFTRTENYKKIEQKPLSEFKGKTITITGADRLATGNLLMPDGTTVNLKGGWAYPSETGNAWAVAGMEKGGSIVNRLNEVFKKEGVSHLGIRVMTEDSVLSNYSTFIAAANYIQSALINKDITKKELLDRIASAYANKSMDGKSSSIKTSIKSNEVVSALLNDFSVDNSTFDHRKWFLQSVLGGTNIKAKSVWGGLPTSGELIKRVSDPSLEGVRKQSLIAVVQIDSPVTMRATTKERDGQEYHDAYPVVIEAKSPKVFLLDGAYNIEDVVPHFTQAATGEVVKRSDYEKAGKEILGGYSSYVNKVTGGAAQVVRNIQANTKAPQAAALQFQQEEVDTVKNLPKEEEGGTTLNVDGSKYSGGGLVIPIVSVNTTQQKLSSGMISDFTDKNKSKISSDDFKIGVYKFPNSNNVSIDLNLVATTKNMDVAVEFARLAGQESLFNLGNFENIKTGSDGKNPMNFTDDQVREIAIALRDGKVPDVFGDAKKSLISGTHVSPYMTEDGGDYIFFHKSGEDADSIRQGIDSSNRYSTRTSKDEKSLQYGIASYYTQPNDAEGMVSGDTYQVRVPKSEVYPIDLDPNGYRLEAEKYITEGTPFRNEKIKKSIASAAKADGYKMIVGEWNYDPKKTGRQKLALRADAVSVLKPESTNADNLKSNVDRGIKVVNPEAGRAAMREKIKKTAKKISEQLSSKGNFGEAYSIVEDARVYGSVPTSEELDVVSASTTRALADQFKTSVMGLQLQHEEEGKVSKELVAVVKRLRNILDYTDQEIRDELTDDGFSEEQIDSVLEDANDTALDEEAQTEYDKASSIPKQSLGERIGNIIWGTTGTKTAYAASETFKSAGIGNLGRNAYGDTTTISMMVESYINFINDVMDENDGNGIEQIMNYFGFDKNARKPTRDIEEQLTKQSFGDKQYGLANVLLAYIQNANMSELNLTQQQLVAYSNYLKKVSQALGRKTGQLLNTGKISKVMSDVTSQIVSDNLLNKREANALDEASAAISDIIGGTSEQPMTDEELLSAEELSDDAEKEQQVKQSSILQKVLRLSSSLVKKEKSVSETTSKRAVRRIDEEIAKTKKDIKNLLNKLKCD